MRTSHACRLQSISFAAALVSGVTAAAGAAPMNVSLGFATLPSAQGFTYSAVGSHAGTPEASVFSVAGNVLTQNTIGLSNGVSGGSILYQLSGGITTTEPKQILVRARCLAVQGSSLAASGQGGFLFGFNQGSANFYFGLTPTQIFVGQPTGSVLIPGTFDNSTQFHDYLFDWTPPSSFRIYRDNVLVFTGSGGFAFAQNRLFLGDGTGGANARGDIESYQFLQGEQPTPAHSTTWGRVKALSR